MKPWFSLFSFSQRKALDLGFNNENIWDRAGESCKVPSVFLLDPSAFSLYWEGERDAFSSACVAQGCGWRGGGGGSSHKCPSCRPSLLPGGGAQRSSRGLIPARLLSARNQPWVCIVHTRDGRRVNSAIGGYNHFSVEMSNKAFIFLLKSKKKK